ncbi:PRCC protein, partial [Polyodon spathula]|nr:PRCC protein [Polyodon spathula]
MSLVAYASSDDSDSEDPSTASKPLAGTKKGGFFSSLPAPKNPNPESQRLVLGGFNVPPCKQSGSLPPPREGTGKPWSPQPVPKPSSPLDPDCNPGETKLGLPAPKIGHFGLSLPPPVSGGGLNLARPKKRAEPVKITIPEIHQGGPDSDEDEPVRKKGPAQAPGLGLSSLLPQPRNMTIKETHRPLVPHTLTKRKPEPRASARTTATAASSVSSSPSAIKAAAKFAALQLARQMAQEEEEEEEGSDEDLEPKNYFSLPERGSPLPEPDPVVPPGTEPPLGSFQSDAPLDFGSASANWSHQQGEQYYSPYPEAAGPNPSQEGYYQDYYSSGVEDSDPALPQSAASGSSSLIDDEAFRRLQGKRNRGKEEVTFLEIKGDDQLSGNQQWLTKGITEEKEQRKSFSKKKGDQPTGQQRRKHQITYLIHQAKERELELKNSWAENKLTRRQTQAKYGF